MTRTVVVTDSSAYLPDKMVKQYGLHVVPLYVHFGEQTFRDRVDLTSAAFYEKLRDADSLPTTSQPSVGDFVELYRRLSQEAEGIVSVHISSDISGTVDSALTARQTLIAEATTAGEKPPAIHVIDSRCTSMGLGLLTTAAARAAAEGQSAEEVARMVEGLIPRVMVVFVVDTLEYLHKGGRIGGAAALVGSVLQVKPVLYFNEGRIDVLEKVRTTRKAKRRLLEIIEERMGTGTTVHAAITHADAPDEAEKLRQQVTERFNCVEMFVCELSPAIATHVGPGTVGLAFYPERV
ncbi:MAG: DegV family protein [Anaerolineae bacterium]|nr:DegV family protein [Anaerolineae bacterium]